MAKRGRPKGSGKKPVAGEQLSLIDVGPENIEEITPHIRQYKEAMSTRLKALKVEVKEKNIILELVKKAHLKRLEDGNIRFTCADMLIEITPRDEVIRIKNQSSKAGKRANKSMQKTVTETEVETCRICGFKETDNNDDGGAHRTFIEDDLCSNCKPMAVTKS